MSSISVLLARTGTGKLKLVFPTVPPQVVVNVLTTIVGIDAEYLERYPATDLLEALNSGLLSHAHGHGLLAPASSNIYEVVAMDETTG